MSQWIQSVTTSDTKNSISLRADMCWCQHVLLVGVTGVEVVLNFKHDKFINFCLCHNWLEKLMTRNHPVKKYNSRYIDTIHISVYIIILLYQ